jgi:primosomal protein N' (replication factor Y)
VDVAWVYAESSGKLGDLHYLAERGLVTLSESEVWRDPLAQVDVIPVEPPMLTHDQQVAWLNIQANIQAACTGRAISPILLHGVTGSGKTEIYLRAVGEILELGKQAIVLVPEIALTPQTVRRFASRFPGRLGLAHSGLSAGERYDTWRRARAGLISIVVGPRSALFTPFHNLGLIIVDEFHDDSYYQSENDPHYHARQAAILYARLSGATCLLGSATPDVASRYLAERGRWQYLNLPMRILAHRQVVQAQVARLGLKSRYRLLDADAETMDLPPVHIVDMRQELKEGNRSIFSRALKSALEETVARNHQAILFINRRGKATYVFCRDCGCVLKCPRCGLPLTYHVHAAKEPASVENTEVLICHYCNYRRKPPQRCPQCGNDRIRYYGMGTERVEDEVRSLLPEVRILRWDYETTRKKGTHEIILSHFVNHRADILVGTQMIAKGLDLPLVTLVGGVLADVGLNLPDYRASERTFQVLTQVAGRAGRSPLGGQVILQTFMPEHYVIQAASQHDYRAFYQRELEYRRDLKYPPFTRLVRLEYRHPLADQAELAARKQASRVRAWLAAKDHRATEMIGPVPCFFNRIGGKYRWQIVLRGPDPVSILRGRDLGDWKVEVDPTSLL